MRTDKASGVVIRSRLVAHESERFGGLGRLVLRAAKYAPKSAFGVRAVAGWLIGGDFAAAEKYFFAGIRIELKRREISPRV